MADGRHFENRYSSICQPRIVRIWWNLVCRRKYWARRRKRDKNSEIPKFKMVDGRHIENHFLAITRLHIVRLRRNLRFWGTIARAQRLGDENVKIRKSNMADGRHFENHYIFISQPQIVRIARNLVCRHNFTAGDGNDKKIRNSQIQNSGWTPHWKSLFGYNSAACCPIKMKFGMRRQNHTYTKQVKWSNA